MSSQHQYALLSPWYQRARSNVSVLEGDARAPVIQKYVNSDYVERLLRDPRDSIQFDPSDDVWSYSVPIGAVPNANTTARRKLSGRIRVSSDLRKLYQPNHERFYVVVVELACDEPRFPLPSKTDGLTVGFVVRRIRNSFAGSDDNLKQLAREVTTVLAGTQTDPAFEFDSDDRLGVNSLLDLASAHAARRTRFLADHANLIELAQLTRTREQWAHDDQGEFAWTTVAAQPPGRQILPSPLDEPSSIEELQLPMWRLPAGDTCKLASNRALWFGNVPTYSGDHDSAGQPKLDDQSTYFIQCFVREDPPAGHEHCPPRIWWSDESRPYRLAAFFDPDGTKNRTVSVKLPDLRSLAARAGEGSGGGLQFERPPRSTLGFAEMGKIPTSGSADDANAETCTLAIELFTIVAMFLFNLFLPIVVLVFQLWWMLLLKFCWPKKGAAIAALQAFFATNAPLPPVGPTPQETRDARVALGDMFGLATDDGTALTDRLTAAGIPNPPAAAKQQAIAILGAMEAVPAQPVVQRPESKPDDPLCAIESAP